VAKEKKKEEAAPEAEGAPPKKKRGLIKIILLVLILLALGGGGFFAYTKFFKAPAAPVAEGAEAEHAAEPAKAESGHGGGGGKAKEGGHGKEGDKGGAASNMVTLQPFVVNLADPQGRRYLKLNLDVECRNVDAAKQLTDVQPKVRDAVILLLSSKSYADLSSLESKILLKEEIVERINQVVGAAKTTKVYFTDMVIQ
jgi:flagellar FliL protein